MVNAARLKGIHTGMKGGLCAAETLLQALLAEDFSEGFLMRYSRSYLESWAGKELQETRNFHHLISHGLSPWVGLRLGIALVAGGWVPGDPLACGEDAGCTQTVESFYGKAGLKRSDLDPGLKFDGCEIHPETRRCLSVGSHARRAPAGPPEDRQGRCGMCDLLGDEGFAMHGILPPPRSTRCTRTSKAR